MKEIQMSFYSLSNLFDKGFWVTFINKLELIFDQNLSHLDVNDPVRRKVLDIESASDYICTIGAQESSRKIFGKFGKSKIEFSLSAYKDRTHFPNSFSIYFPEDIANSEKGLRVLRTSFEECNFFMRPFYSICDSMEVIATKRKSTGYAVDLQAELIGVFWLTYFNGAYLEYFGRSKFLEIPCRQIEGIGGKVIEVGEFPISQNVDRDKIENLLGKASFVDPELGYDKPIGKNALLFAKLEP